jgi:membrane associated rhomboid family serine protease
MFRNIPPITKNLIIINAIVWLAMVLLPSMNLDGIGGLHYFTSPDFRPWQFLTYMFMHSSSGIAHIFFNMFGLLMFGSTLERVFGSAKYLFFYLTVGIGAGLVQEGVYAIWISHLAGQLPAGVLMSQVIEEGYNALSQGMNFMDPTLSQLNLLINVPTIGASGALYGVLLAFGMIFPNMPLYLFFIPVPIKAKWMVLGYGAIELLLGVTGMQSGVAHFAHLGGMIVAFFLIIYWRKKGVINNEPLY